MYAHAYTRHAHAHVPSHDKKWGEVGRQASHAHSPGRDERDASGRGQASLCATADAHDTGGYTRDAPRTPDVTDTPQRAVRPHTRRLYAHSTRTAGARLLWNARAWAGAKRAHLLEIESNLMCSFRPLVSSPAVRKKPRFTSDGRRSGAKTQPHLGRTDALPSTAARAVVSYRKLEWATRRGMARLLMLDRPAPHAAASRALTWSHRHARAPGRPGRALPRVGHGSAGRARVVEYLARATAYRR